MPLYLKKDAIRLLEASVNAVCLAVTSVGLPQRFESRESSSEYSMTAGLVGVSAELALSSILVQAQGLQCLKFPSGFYKTGSHILSDFRKLILSQIPKLVFLTQGIDCTPAKHLEKILDITSSFSIVAQQRAFGLHAGLGPSRDVSVKMINDVIGFLELIGKSSRIKPYVDSLPRKIEMTKSYELVADDLIRKASEATTNPEKTNAILSLFLVTTDSLHNFDSISPIVERIALNPNSSDITFLLDHLTKSRCASLIKVSKSSVGIPASVNKNHPFSIPIEPQYLKKSFNDVKDRFYADVGNANGRLEKKQFDPPPIDSIYEMFASQIMNLEIMEAEHENRKFTAVEMWPFVASCLSYKGTLGPYWYFVRQADDLNQLEGYINQALICSGQTLKTGYKEFKPLLDSLKKGTTLSKQTATVASLLAGFDESVEARKSLAMLIRKNKNSERELQGDAIQDINAIASEDLPSGTFLAKVVQNNYEFKTDSSKLYWTHKLCVTCSEIEDLPGLLLVLQTPNLSVAHTHARKAIRLIDFINFGPRIA